MIFRINIPHGVILVVLMFTIKNKFSFEILSPSVSLSLSLYIYIYIYREREREMFKRELFIFKGTKKHIYNYIFNESHKS